MPNLNQNERRLAQALVENIFRALIEDGEIEIRNKSTGEIVEEYLGKIDDIIRGEHGLNYIGDHTETLLDRAQAEAEAEHYNLAITFYAIWIEHFINGVLIRALERAGHDRKVGSQLIRELRLATKATALWAIAGLPAIPDTCLKLLDKIVEFRNAFIHYKWPSHDEPLDERQTMQLKDTVAQAPSLVSDLLSIQSQAFWNGREQELIDH